MPSPLEKLQSDWQTHYSDMPFETFVGKVHDKFYSDLPMADFTDKLGLTVAPTVNSAPVSRNLSDVPGEAMGNLVPSAGRFAEGVVSPLLHPVKTVEGVSKVARGALGVNKEEAPAWDATKQFFADRYGGWKNVKNTMATDPVGFMADLSTILTGGGSLAAKAPGVVGKVGAGVKAVGEAINPATLPLKGAAAVANKVAGSSIPTDLYTSALKPSTALSAEERLKRVQTALKERVPVTEKGMAQLEEGISGLNRDVSQIVANATNQGKTISRASLVDELDKLQNFYIENYADPRPYVGAIDRIKNGLAVTKPSDIPLGQAQSIKQNIYREIKNAYDAAAKAGASQAATGAVQGRKTLARAIKTEIENIVPEVKDLNARESAMIGLNESIERAVGRISNWDVLGLAAPVVGAAAGATPVSKIATTLAYRIVGNPSFKSHVALVLSKTRKVPPMAGTIPLATRGINLLTAPGSQDEEGSQYR